MRTPLRTTLLLAAAAYLPAARAADSAPATPRLPAAAQAAFDEFRKIDWSERCKPSRPDPAPDGWQARVRAEAAFAALDAKDWPTLRVLLSSDDRFVRALAAEALGLSGDGANTPFLAAALAEERDKPAKIAMIAALGRTGGVEALPAVEAQQAAGGDADVSWAVGMARRQIKGTRWDVANLRAEFVDAARVQFAEAAVGKDAPELALPGLERPVNLSALRGKVVVVAFCHGDRDAPMEKALQRLAGQQQDLARMGVEVVVVAPHEKERTDAWAKHLAMPWITYAADPGARAQSAYGVARQIVVGGEWMPSPAWFVVNRKGALVWQRIGKQAGDHASLGDLLPVVEKTSQNIGLK